MKIYTLKRSQKLNQNLESVFSFFEKPENLQKLTPQHLSFKILTPSPIAMKVGSEIDYVIRLNGVPLKWKTLITHYVPLEMFVDKQIKGPYALWEHTHRFSRDGEGTLIEDEVRYALPMGILGQMAHALWVKRQLKGIFDYRAKVVNTLLAK